MLCTKEVLKAALSAHAGYLPTASEHLRLVREKWIPVSVKKRADKKKVRLVVESVLQGTYGAEFDTSAMAYARMREEHRVAVAMCLTVAWSHELQRLHLEGQRASDYTNALTDRVFTWLEQVDIDHAVLAVRNFSLRDGSQISGMSLILAFECLKIKSCMDIYFKIRAHWMKFGSDWERRGREEAARRAQGLPV